MSEPALTNNDANPAKISCGSRTIIFSSKKEIIKEIVHYYGKILN